MRIQIEGKWRKYKNPEVLLQNNKDIYNWAPHTSLSHTLTWLTQTAENVLLGNSNWSSRKSKILFTLIETQMGVTVWLWKDVISTALQNIVLPVWEQESKVQ